MFMTSCLATKKPRTSTLFDEYTESDDELRRQPGASRTSHSLTLQINKYLGMDYDYSEDSLAFWHRNKDGLDKLFSGSDSRGSRGSTDPPTFLVRGSNHASI
jgi:hypothetical protein